MFWADTGLMQLPAADHVIVSLAAGGVLHSSGISSAESEYEAAGGGTRMKAGGSDTTEFGADFWLLGRAKAMVNGPSEPLVSVAL